MCQSGSVIVASVCKGKVFITGMVSIRENTKDHGSNLQ